MYWVLLLGYLFLGNQQVNAQFLEQSLKGFFGDMEYVQNTTMRYYRVLRTQIRSYNSRNSYIRQFTWNPDH